jgi:hypothetical protein
MLKARAERKELRIRAPVDVVEWAERQAKAYGASITAVIVDAVEDTILRRGIEEQAAERPARKRA